VIKKAFPLACLFLSLANCDRPPDKNYKEEQLKPLAVANCEKGQSFPILELYPRRMLALGNLAYTNILNSAGVEKHYDHHQSYVKEGSIYKNGELSDFTNYEYHKRYRKIFRQIFYDSMTFANSYEYSGNSREYIKTLDLAALNLNFYIAASLNMGLIRGDRIQFMHDINELFNEHFEISKFAKNSSATIQINNVIKKIIRKPSSKKSMVSVVLSVNDAILDSAISMDTYLWSDIAIIYITNYSKNDDLDKTIIKLHSIYSPTIAYMLTGKESSIYDYETFHSMFKNGLFDSLTKTGICNYYLIPVMSLSSIHKENKNINFHFTENYSEITSQILENSRRY